MILGIPVWAVWAIAAAFLAVGELFTPGLFFVAGADALVGRRALVLERVDATGGGRVKIGGEERSARPYLEGDALPIGEQVEVGQIDGATAPVLR